MAAIQQIFRIRRSYNQWVNNQTLEDYALRFTATGSRRWSLTKVANTALGAISFLALEAIGGAITLSYGTTNAVSAILVVGLLIFLAGVPICYYASRYGVDIDLLTRGAGFGYIGSTATSLIYASFTFIFFCAGSRHYGEGLGAADRSALGVGVCHQFGNCDSVGISRHYVHQSVSALDPAPLAHHADIAADGNSDI